MLRSITCRHTLMNSVLLDMPKINTGLFLDTMCCRPRIIQNRPWGLGPCKAGAVSNNVLSIYSVVMLDACLRIHILNTLAWHTWHIHSIWRDFICFRPLLLSLITGSPNFKNRLSFLHVSCLYIKGECLLLVSWLKVPACSPDGREALPLQQRSQQPVLTAGEEMEGGVRINILIGLSHECGCANLWIMTNKYHSFTDLAEQLYKVNTF